jgi:histidine ammonia-lyase
LKIFSIPLEQIHDCHHRRREPHRRGRRRVCRRDASGAFAKVALDKGARERVMATRAWLDANFMNDEAPLMYSFNTGVGLFKDQRVLMKDMIEYQTKTVYAHATGVGEPFAEDVARATMLLRANAFASNYSGPRVDVLDRLIDCLNAGLTPVIPQKGSVGASGDLAPLAHMSGASAASRKPRCSGRASACPRARRSRRRAFRRPSISPPRTRPASSTARPCRSRWPCSPSRIRGAS